MAHPVALACLHALLAAAPQPRLAVMAVKPEGGTPSTVADAVTQAVVSEVRRQSRGYAVIGWGEIRALVSMEHDKQQLGCDQVSCLSEIGGAIGAASIINGTLTRIGSVYLLALRLVDVRHAQVLKEGTERVGSGNDDDLLDAVTRAVHQLFPGRPLPARLGVAPNPPAPAGATAEAPETPTHSHVLGISLVAAAFVASGVALYGVLGPVDSYQSEFSQASTALQGGAASPYTSAQLKGDYQTAQSWEIVSSVLLAVGVGTLLGGIFTW